MGKETGIWFGLFLLSVLLIVTGFKGQFGQLLAIAFIPGDLSIVGANENNVGVTSATVGTTTTIGAVAPTARIV